MRFQQTIETDLPLHDLYRAHRDELGLWAPRMPEIRRVHTTSRARRGATLRLENEWWGALEVLPFPVRRFVTENDVCWHDVQVWDDQGLTCRWTLRIPALGDAARIEGEHAYSAFSSGTRIELSGDFTFVPGQGRLQVPAVVVPLIERAVAALVGVVLSRSVRVLAQHVRAA